MPRQFNRPGRARRVAGFTLVELAIVLVIIGLIIGGVLTAQQITQNARITSAIQGLKSVQAAAQSYHQNYGALPGDDGGASTRFGDKVPGSGDGNGMIGGGVTLQSTYNIQGNNEGTFFWSHLRAAGLIKGNSQTPELLGNPFGGVYGVQNGAFSDGFALGVNVLCLDHASGAAAQAIDQQLDDGKPGSGNILGGSNITGAKADNYNNANSNYILCTPLQ